MIGCTFEMKCLHNNSIWGIDGCNGGKWWELVAKTRSAGDPLEVTELWS
jgi:hypothetical protein